MNIYLISQDKVNGYDVFDSAVVVAESAEVAATIHPDSEWKGEVAYLRKIDYDTWVSNPLDVNVEFIGTTDKTERQCICASFNAG